MEQLKGDRCCLRLSQSSVSRMVLAGAEGRQRKSRRLMGTQFRFGLVEDALHCAFKGYHDNFSMFTSSSVMEGDLDQSPVFGDSLRTELHESSSISPGH